MRERACCRASRHQADSCRFDVAELVGAQPAPAFRGEQVPPPGQAQDGGEHQGGERQQIERCRAAVGRAVSLHFDTFTNRSSCNENGPTRGPFSLQWRRRRDSNS